MNNRVGFSLLELLIAIAIIGIMLSIATLSFNQWQVNYNIESQTRELYSDLIEARTTALQTKMPYSIVFQPRSYVMTRYSSENEPVANGTVVKNRTLSHGLTKGTTGDIADSSVLFDTQGLTYNKFTVVVNPLTASPACNCLVIFDTRVNMGKINGTACEFK